MSALDPVDAEMAETIRRSSLGTSEIVAAILAAGWVKPRTITTPEELEELKSGVVVRSALGEFWEKLGHRWDNLSEAGDLIYPPWYILLPATVLYEPS